MSNYNYSLSQAPRVFCFTIYPYVKRGHAVMRVLEQLHFDVSTWDSTQTRIFLPRTYTIWIQYVALME